MSAILVTMWLLAQPGPNDTLRVPDVAAARDHWAFQPTRRAILPPVADRDWCASPIDRFILARIEAAGRQPAAPASRHVWLRRVTYDLTGLPPTPEELGGWLPGPLRLPDDPAQLFSPEHRSRIATLEDDRSRLEQTRPDFPRAMGVAQRFLENGVRFVQDVHGRVVEDIIA